MSPSSLVTTHIDPESIPWAKYEQAYGTFWMRLLHCSPEQNTFTNIIRFSTGVQLPRHLHTGSVHAYTFSGRWRYLEYDWEATAGSFVHEPVGTTHTLRVEEEAVAMFVTQGGFLWYDGRGRPAFYQDAASTLEECRAMLAKEGLDLPAGVVR